MIINILYTIYIYSLWIQLYINCYFKRGGHGSTFVGIIRAFPKKAASTSDGMGTEWSTLGAWSLEDELSRRSSPREKAKSWATSNYIPGSLDLRGKTYWELNKFILAQLHILMSLNPLTWNNGSEPWNKEK